MLRFSLIVATIHRTEELAVLLHSLSNQSFRAFELIIVDQNDDDRIVKLLQSWTAENAGTAEAAGRDIQIKHLLCAPGVSRARNLGIQHSRGEILCFPDDDCWYYPDTLQRVDEWFATHSAYGILCLGSRDAQGRVSNNRWVQAECDLNRINVFRTSATYTYFIRRPEKSIRFDESLGPASGTPFGCGEDTDFVLALMHSGIRGRRYSPLFVGHPTKGYINVQRAEQYGGGFGRVLAKHSLPLLCLALVLFDCARAIAQSLRGNRDRASHLWAHGRGMARAYFAQ